MSLIYILNYQHVILKRLDKSDKMGFLICNTDNTDPICHVQATIQTIFDVVDPGFGLESVEPYYGMEGGEGMLLKKFQMDFKSRPYPYPIIPENVKCRKECNKDVNLIYEADKRYGKNLIQLPSSPRQIQLEIMKNGPVAAGMYIYNSFQCYESGIYHKVEDVDGPRPLAGHAVKIIGWGVENETPYWLISNSHGEVFGENGTFRIVRGKDDCRIESDEIVAGLPR
nr:unnamed protein product [Callosobruchus analis]